MQKIVPHLWFDTQAKDAAAFYVSAFGGASSVTNTTTIHETPSGDCDIVSFTLAGYEFMAINAGPIFTINPSISFFVHCDSEQEVDALWERLAEGGSPLMPVGEYPFCKRYGWVKDKFGVSWQVMLVTPASGEEPRPKIVPSLMFTRSGSGKCEEATEFWMSVFRDSKRGKLSKYPGDEKNVMFTDFTLEKQWFAAMDGGEAHEFQFNEAVSLVIRCKDQEEIDYYFERLSAVPQAEQCGWLQDKFGVSWQVTPFEMDEMLQKGDAQQVDRVTKAFLGMKKFDLAALRKAYQDS